MKLITAVMAILLLLAAGPVAVSAASDSRVGTFASGRCPVELDTPRHVDCGTVRLPQVRSDPSHGNVRVQIAIARAKHPLPDPILFVMGGPDYPGVDAFSTLYLGGKGFSANRDWILFDARGTGSSEPRLSCPELDDADAAAFPEDPKPGGLANPDLFVHANRSCRQRLEGSGVVPTAYASVDVARDLRDLRRTLEIKEWNVVGLSAGGEATLELMRIDPDGIRSVILDSPVTRNYRPSFDFLEWGTRLIDRAFRGCAKQAACATAYPDLRSRFLAEVDRLAVHPIKLDVKVAGGGTVAWTIDGSFLLEEGAAFTAAPDGAAEWPAVADFLARGHIEDYVADIVLDPPLPYDDVIARGRTMASRCRDAYAFQTVSMLAGEGRTFPRLADNFSDWYGTDMRACRAWQVGRSSETGYGYIDSDLPVLTLRGEWDNAASDNGNIVEQARHFPRGWAFTFPAHGHIQLLDWNGDPSCAIHVATEFMANPSVRPNASCIGQMAHVVFKTGAAADHIVRPNVADPLESRFALRP